MSTVSLALVLHIGNMQISEQPIFFISANLQGSPLLQKKKKKTHQNEKPNI